MAIGTISGASWPTSGNVTTGNSGFYNILATAGTLIYKPFGSAGAIDAAPSGATSASYIEYQCEGVVNTGGFYKDDWTDVSNAVTTGNKTYELEMYVQIAKTNNWVNNTTPADGTAFYLHNFGNVYSGFRLYVQNSATNGRGLLYRHVVGGGITNGVEKGFTACEGTTQTVPCLKLDTWYRFKIMFRAGANQSYYQVFMNGRLVGSCTSSSGFDFGTLANVIFQFHMPSNVTTFPSGLVIRFCGPVVSSASVLTNTQYTGTVNIKEDCVKDLPVRFLGTYNENRWTGSGTATATATTYGIAGIIPFRYFLAYTGTAGQTHTIDSEKLYIPNTSDLSPFNEQGWTTVRVIGFKATGTTRSTFEFAIYESTNSSKLLSLTLNAAGDLVDTSSGTVIFSSLAVDNYYSLLIHMSNMGEVRLTLFDLSNTSFSATSVRSAYYGTISQTNSYHTTGIGKFQCVMTMGNSGSPAMGGIQVLRWATVPMVDSYVHTTATSVTPNLAVKNNVWKFRDAEEHFSLPGGYSPRVYGGSNDCVTGAIVARSGQTLSSLYSSLSTAFANSRGIRLCQLCGLVNDKSTLTTTNYNTWVDYTVNFAKSVIANYNKFWWATCVVPPGDGGSFNVPQAFKDAVPLYNAATATQLQLLGNLVETSDIATAVPSLNWDAQGIHPNLAGCQSLWEAMGTVQTTAKATVSDLFVDTAGTDLAEHATTYGEIWIKNRAYPASSIKVDGNGNAYNTAYSNSIYHLLTTPASADYTTTASFVFRGEPAGAFIGVRCVTNSLTGYYAGYFGNAWRLYRYVDGISTQLGSSVVSTGMQFNYTYPVSLQVSTSGGDAALTFSVNGSPVITYTDSSASKLTGAGYSGLMLFRASPGVGMWVQNFTASNANNSLTLTTNTDNGYSGAGVDKGLFIYGDTHGYGTGTPGGPTSAAAGYSYVSRLNSLLTAQYGVDWYVNNASIENSLANISTVADADDALVASNLYSDGYVCVLQAGAYEMLNATMTPTALYDAMRTFCLARRAAGWKVGVATLLPADVSTAPGYNSNRSYVNDKLRNGYTEFADFLVDIGNHPILGKDGVTSDTRYYNSDKTHLTSLGHLMLAETFYSALSKYMNNKITVEQAGDLVDAPRIIRAIRSVNWSTFFVERTDLVNISCQRRDGYDRLVAKACSGADTNGLKDAIVNELVKSGVSFSANSVIVEIITDVASRTRSRTMYPGSFRSRKGLTAAV